jgi:hypothetical protein
MWRFLQSSGPKSAFSARMTTQLFADRPSGTAMKLGTHTPEVYYKTSLNLSGKNRPSACSLIRVEGQRMLPLLVV